MIPTAAPDPIAAVRDRGHADALESTGLVTIGFIQSFTEERDHHALVMRSPVMMSAYETLKVTFTRLGPTRRGVTVP